MYVVYRHFNSNGELIYVGQTHDPSERLSKHRTNSLWWDLVASTTYTRYETLAEATQAEITAIRTERPLWNRNHAMRMTLINEKITAATPFVKSLYTAWPAGTPLLSALEIQNLMNITTGFMGNRIVAELLRESGIESKSSNHRRGYKYIDVEFSVKLTTIDTA